MSFVGRARAVTPKRVPPKTLSLPARTTSKVTTSTQLAGLVEGQKVVVIPPKAQPKVSTTPTKTSTILPKTGTVTLKAPTASTPKISSTPTASTPKVTSAPTASKSSGSAGHAAAGKK